MKKINNAGKYNNIIEIIKVNKNYDKDGFKTEQRKVILKTYSSIKTLRGYTLIQNNSDFEKAYTNFTIRYPKTKIDRKMLIKYNEKIYSIEYLNNIDEKNLELEIQAKEITK
nr:MAG TPA: putative head tail adaptor [Caudoviricetes sp.]